MTTVVPIRSKVSKVEDATGVGYVNNDEYRHRCSSTTISFKILESLLLTLTFIGNVGWKDYSKTGCWIHITRSSVYAIVVIIFLSTNVIRWCFIFNGNDQFGVELIFKLIFVIWGFETLGHSIGFFVASVSYKRLPELLFEWDKVRSQCGQNIGSLKKQTDICTAVAWLLACLNIAFCTYPTFAYNLQEHVMYPVSMEDDHYKVLVMKIVNLVVESYLIFAWVTPSALLFVVTNALTWEFNYTTQQIRELCQKSGKFSLGRIRAHHQKLCNLVDQADDIFSMQIATTFLGSLTLICSILYALINGDDVSIMERLIQVYWLTTAALKIFTDCVSGARLNNAVSTIYKQRDICKMYLILLLLYKSIS